MRIENEIAFLLGALPIKGCGRDKRIDLDDELMICNAPTTAAQLAEQKVAVVFIAGQLFLEFRRQALPEFSTDLTAFQRSLLQRNAILVMIVQKTIAIIVTTRKGRCPNEASPMLKVP